MGRSEAPRATIAAGSSRAGAGRIGSSALLRALAASEQRFRGMLDGMLEGCQIVGSDYRYRYVNAAAARHDRRTRAELVGASMLELYPGIQHTRLFEALTRCQQTRAPQRLETEIRYQDGSRAWFDLSLQAVPEGVFILSVEITAQKQAERESQRLQLELERRVEERTAELRLANQELESFADAVSHDLRAPLRAMLCFSQALQLECGASLGEGRAHIEQIQRAGARMSELIDGLLALSGCTRAELHRAPVDLSALAERIRRDLAAGAARPVACEIEPGLTAFGDPRLIELLLRNLFDNAWKYTARSSAPRVCLYGAGSSPGRRSFCVEDNGVGFAAHLAPRLFQPFQRLHDAAEFPGIGIGLATVQRIVRRHGGEIDASGVLGEGASFRFSLPAVGESD